MSPHALLLSPDDQAVSAITGVLEEMSVNCERPMDGASAAHKLNSQTYDLVLVDCDNLPAAKLIFDVCRRATAGTSIPIAIVDGRAGLPTAFRLGAELILTKPVAKDQARTTIRTAVSRLRKEDPAKPLQPVVLPPVVASAPAAPAAPPEPLVQAAAASAAPAPAKCTDAPIAPAPVAGKPTSRSFAEPVLSAAGAPAPASSSLAAAPSVSPSPAVSGFPSAIAKPPAQPSDDPVMAELEEQQPGTPSLIFSSYEPAHKSKGRGLLVSVVVLMILGAGSYAAWMTQPQFREFMQPQLDKVMALVGVAAQPKAVRPAQTSVPQSNSGNAASKPTVTSLDSTPSALAPAPPPSPAPAAVDNSKPAAEAAAPVALAPAVAAEGKSSSADSSAAQGNKPATPLPTESGLSWEKDTLILSSRGAERRLIYRVAPQESAQGRSPKLEGTVVLKALVSASGRVEEVRLLDGNSALADPAIRAVKQWRYRPYLRDGKPVPFQTITIVDFQQP